jgi:hypothetical protein
MEIYLFGMSNGESSLRRKFTSVWPLLDERSRRLMAASEAVSLGYGRISRIRLASGISRKAIANGIREIAEGTALPGAGRKSITEIDPKLLASLERLKYPTGRKVTNQEIKRVNLKQNKFHGVWNYTIRPSMH